MSILSVNLFTTISAYYYVLSIPPYLKTWLKCRLFGSRLDYANQPNSVICGTTKKRRNVSKLQKTHKLLAHFVSSFLIPVYRPTLQLIHCPRNEYRINFKTANYTFHIFHSSQLCMLIILLVLSDC